MSFTSNPITPVAGEEFIAQNPAAGSGNLSSQAVIVKNVSPYLLSVADGSGSIVGLVDPYTTDLVPLSADAGQQIEVTPTDLGLLPAGSVPPLVYLTWYAQSETVPGNYPFALPLTTIINDSSTPIPVVTVGGMAYASLTGAGETETPGDLVQLGGFIVDDGDAGDDITFTGPNSTGLFHVQNLNLEAETDAYLWASSLLRIGKNSGGGVTDLIEVVNTGSAGWTSGNDLQFESSAGNLRLLGGGGGTIVIAGGANTITINAEEIGFFAVEPVGPQVSGGTTAGVIAGLVELGLFSS